MRALDQKETAKASETEAVVRVLEDARITSLEQLASIPSVVSAVFACFDENCLGIRLDMRNVLDRYVLRSPAPRAPAVDRREPRSPLAPREMNGTRESVRKPSPSHVICLLSPECRGGDDDDDDDDVGGDRRNHGLGNRGDLLR